MSDFRAQVAVGLVTAAVGLVLLGLLVRRLAGPVFAHELTVLARRGYQPRLRAGLVVVLLAALLLTYVSLFGWDAVSGRTPTVDPRSSRFAERFALTTLAVQLLTVVVLTPAVVGSAITEERDRGTLDLLRTTELTDHEIVVGKLLARLAVVGGVVAAGLPVLALTLLFGGVDPNRLLGVYAVTAVTAFGLGAASVYLGAVLDGLRSVLAAVYAGVMVSTVAGTCCWAVPAVGGLSPASLAFLVWVHNEPMAGRLTRYWWLSAVSFGLLYGGGGLVSVWWAIGRVRGTAIRRTDEPADARPVQRLFFVRPLGDDEDPLVWHEREFGGRRFGGGELRFACGSLALFVVGAGLFVAGAQAVEQGEWIARGVAAVVRPTLAAAAAVLPLVIGLRLAGAVAGERERHTLDALLMLPGDRLQILWAKTVTAVGWVGWGIALLAASVAAAVLVGGIGVVAATLAVCQVGAAVGAAVGLAAWLSVREQTGARATTLFLVAVLTVNVVPLLAGPLSDMAGGETGQIVRAVCPVVATWVSCGGAGRIAIAALLPAALYAVGGWLLWRAAERRLERGERRG